MGVFRTTSIPSKIGNYMVHMGKPGVLDLGPESVIVGYAQKQIGQEEVQVGEDENHLPVYGIQPIYEDDETQPIYEATGYWLYEVDGDPPTEQEVEVDYEEPEPVESPLTDVEIMTPVFIDYRRQATLHLDELKAQVWSYLKNEQEMDPAAATAAGVAFCKSSTGIGVQYDDFIKSGGHPDAAADLWARIQEIKGNFTWFDAGVEAIFAAALGQEV